MKYIKRHTEEVIQKEEKMFKAILVTGARQVGKTTMLKNMKLDIHYITLDDMLQNQSANEDPDLFLKANQPPIIIDEIWNIIHQGSMPALYQEKSDLELYYSMYVNTYIERDVRNLTQVGDTLSFLKFMTALASRIGQLLNLNSVA